MNPLWLRAIPYIGGLLLLAAVLFGAYRHGLSVKDAEWQAEWDKRDARDAQVGRDNEAAERAKEHARQQSINKAIQDGQKLIDAAVADAAAARADVSVRDAADATAHRVAASGAGGHSCTTAASQAATRAALVLADVFKRADERAGDLAGYADQSRGRGVTCEQAFDGLGK